MAKIVFGLLLLLGSIAFAEKREPVTFGELRTRLLLVAEADVYTVEKYPEFMMPTGDSKVDLKFTEYQQKMIKKDQYFRINAANSFETYDMKEGKINDVVYNIVLEELDENLYPTGVSVKVGVRASPGTVVGNFSQIKDQLSMSPTLKTGRGLVGDHVINSFPTVLNNEKIPAYSKFEVIGVTKKYMRFTIAYEYTLQIQNVRTKKIYEIAAPQRFNLPNWAHLVAEKNRRVIKFKGMEFHY
ncbi:hypothetical protein [Bdellovibrio reynosensis]|uniref:Uncharacterized protein n=1 Tax=Bdellovibrio reynosensis TaxID=2835041 RepID=A0ABY4CFV3_9BACT|nr:hypothetical protein [Bdellovibrio reynosensis]UOF02551.1 hypothetical protein MNR06_06245 [Bdellovibrio reynosensis]